jgi:HD-GYP domain-containing protein (c-di-GMP phosphodiesterase class II)
MAEGENEEIIHALGIHDIKQTLVIPLYIGPQYKGALFFDNFDSTTAFTDEDISLAKIVMRISTFFIGQKGMLDELLSATADIKNLSLRLEQLISFQSGISPSEDEKTFFGKLLTLALSIVPHAEKGSVYLAEEGMLKAVCWSGYPDELMQKLEIPLEKELATLKGGSAYIVKNVGVNDFAREEERALAESMGVPTIKAVLNVPLFIDNNYVGGLFLDAFSSENAFDENDVKVVKAISNIANLFLRTRKLLSERRITNIVNNVVIETLRMIAKSANVEDAAIAFLRNLSSRLRIELIGAVFILRLLDRAFVIKVNSSNASSEYIEEVDLPEINEPSLFKKDELLPNGLLESLGDFENAFVAETPEGLYAVFALGKGKLTADEKQILSDTATDVIPILENRELLMEVQKSYIETLVALSRAVDSKDPYTREHSEGVTLYSYLIGKKLNLSFEDMKTLLYAAILHDIGKIGIPDSILLKPGKLTADEYEIVKMHPKLGEDIVGKIGFLREPAEVLLHHHERYDGKGYPSQLAGVEIPFLSRILGVADAFDAMTTERPYRKAMTFDEAVSELVKGKGLQFDPELVDVFVSIPREEIEKALANKSVEEILDETLVGGGYYLKGKLSQTDGNSPHISG